MPQSKVVPRILLIVGALACQARAQTPDPTAPVPVLDGIRILSPGPRALGFPGLAADPSSIGDFQGVVALAYMRGTVRDETGHSFTIVNDLRIFVGDYVSADGIQRRGAFGFV